MLAWSGRRALLLLCLLLLSRAGCGFLSPLASTVSSRAGLISYSRASRSSVSFLQSSLSDGSGSTLTESDLELSLHTLELPLLEYANGYEAELARRFPGCLLVRWHLSEVDREKQVVKAEVVVHKRR